MGANAGRNNTAPGGSGFGDRPMTPPSPDGGGARATGDLSDSGTVGGGNGLRTEPLKPDDMQ